MKPLRMAAYCRVSTQKEAQLDSLAHQEFFRIVRTQRTAGFDAHLCRCRYFRQTNEASNGIFAHVG